MDTDQWCRLIIHGRMTVARMVKDERPAWARPAWETIQEGLEQVANSPGSTHAFLLFLPSWIIDDMFGAIPDTYADFRSDTKLRRMKAAIDNRQSIKMPTMCSLVRDDGYRDLIDSAVYRDAFVEYTEVACALRDVLHMIVADISLLNDKGRTTPLRIAHLEKSINTLNATIRFCSGIAGVLWNPNLLGYELGLLLEDAHPGGELLRMWKIRAEKLDRGAYMGSDFEKFCAFISGCPGLVNDPSVGKRWW
jgi:hypothetical protein